MDLMERTSVQESMGQDTCLPSEKGSTEIPAKFCLECGLVGQPKEYRPGSFRLEIKLWLVIPALWITSFLWGLPSVHPALEAFVQWLGRQYPGVVRCVLALISCYRAVGPLRYLGPSAFLVPGVLYSFWRLTARYSGCASCRSRQIARLDSPYAQTYLATLTPKGVAQPWVCMACATPVFTKVPECPACGAGQANSEIETANQRVGVSATTDSRRSSEDSVSPNHPHTISWLWALLTAVIGHYRAIPKLCSPAADTHKH
jgi:hypothetical protein